MSKNACILRKQEVKRALPAKLYGYLALHEEIKHKNEEIVSSKLPFVSRLTNIFTPKGVSCACWSFLKY